MPNNAMPIMVADLNGAPVEVLTSEDVRQSQRFWVKVFGVAFLSLVISSTVWAVRTTDAHNTTEANLDGSLHLRREVDALEDEANAWHDALPVLRDIDQRLQQPTTHR